MGREIRRVPANWEHPKKAGGNYIPLYDRDIATSGREWTDNCIAWDNGTHPDLVKHPEYKKEYPFYWMYAGDPPDPDTCRPEFTTKPTWVQVYETVSEGTPVTPAFATAEELIDYLVANGDFWDQRSGEGGWSRKNAEAFVTAGWAPSLVVIRSGNSATIMTPRDGA